MQDCYICQSNLYYDSEKAQKADYQEKAVKQEQAGNTERRDI